ncbi:MAG TPA: Na/Pi cotransporter family protein [Patescibacteria group bacterium]|nr:Na/Pi cotransporter family protein [Patescibacteria group bacterium]
MHIIGGVCLLLWGVGMVSSGLNKAFGTTLRRFISNSTSNRFKAFGVGIFTATLLQSSTAASMIVSSFAARNVITISSAIAVMLGADVGTTLAAQIISFDIKWLVPVLLFAGYVTTKVWDESHYKHVGRAMVGLALIFISLSIIRDVASPIGQEAGLKALIAPLSSQPILAIVLAALFTWLVHSSLGTVLLFMSFVQAGMIPVGLGLVLVLGANIGGAIAPVIMTLRDIPAGRRVPLGNLMMRGMGALIFLPFMGTLVAPLVAEIDPDPARQVVNFHTLFNIVVALGFLPFIGSMTKLSEILLPDRAREEDESLPRYLDPTAFATPPAALACVARETLRISDIVQRMMRDTLEAFRSNNTHLVQGIRDQEAIVDSLYESTKNYLARLSSHPLDKHETKRYMQILTFSTNLEHIGDIIDKNLMEMASKKIRNQDNFSRQGFAEISDLHHRVMDNMNLAQNVFMTGDVKMARKLFEEKVVLRNQEMMAAESHFKRLSQGVAETIATSSLHLDILRDLRRINSYVSLIAYPILEEANELKTTRLRTTKPRAKKPPAEKKPS